MNKKIRIYPPSGCIIAVGTLCAAIAPNSSTAEVAVSSPDIHWTDGQAVVADEEAGTANSVLSNLFSPMGLPASADVDAVHGLPDGDVLFSLETTLELDGVVYRPNDVIRYNGESWSKELDGRTSGIPDGVNVDAISVSGNTLLLSLDVGAALAALVVSDADIIAYDGEAFSIFLWASDVGIESSADVDALHLNEHGTLLLSFDAAGQVGGVHYRDEDLLALDGATWSMEVDNNSVAWSPVDLDAWSVVFLRDIIFSDGFELE